MKSRIKDFLNDTFTLDTITDKAIKITYKIFMLFCAFFIDALAGFMSLGITFTLMIVKHYTATSLVVFGIFLILALGIVIGILYYAYRLYNELKTNCGYKD